MTTRYSKTTGTFYPLDNDYGENLPADVINVSQDDANAAMSRPLGATFDFVNGALVITPAPAPTSAQIIASLTVAVQAHLDAQAQTHGYDGILSACTYATSANAKFKAEGQACVTWRDAVWTACYAELAAVQGGTAPTPTEAALIASLPAITWP